jgi:uncharacterized membrane protein YwaF
MIIHKFVRDSVLIFILLLRNKVGKKNVKFLVLVHAAIQLLCCVQNSKKHKEVITQPQRKREAR